jgi:deoxyribodipyrimidine photolyase
VPAPSIVWFRDDLRVADHPALSAGVGAALIALGAVVMLASRRRHTSVG